jgi:CheY-like chemotaxis protein
MVTVFVVDDEPVLHEIYRRMLSYNGHSVIAHAYDGKEALELYKQMSTRITKLYTLI